MKRVLVLDALERSALAVTRSLGLHGVPVITADETSTALAGSSRYSRQFFRYPSPCSRPGAFVSRVIEICKEQHIDLVLPMTELTTLLLLQHRSSLAGVELPFPDSRTVDQLADKCSLMRLADTLGIPFPRTYYANDPGNLPVALNDLPYPLVLKPGRSWLEYNGKWIHTSVRFATDAPGAAAILESDQAFRTGPFMLQETVPGSGQGVFALYDNGKPLAFFAHRRVREKPPRGGVSVLSESIDLDPVLLDHACKLLDTTGWHGIAMVEFRVSDEGTPWLMEVNTRFWGSLQLSVDAGVDFPWLLYRMVFGEHVEPAGEYRKGIRLRWLLGDLDNLYLTLRDKAFPVGTKIRAIWQFLRPAYFRTRHEVNRWRDMGPFWWELKQYFRDLRR